MPDELNPGLLPSADKTRDAEPPSTIDATRSASTFDREIQPAFNHPMAPTIPGYAITGEIARGGMGLVYAATDLTLKREVAIKTLLPCADAARFVTESEITARLPHPGIPPVHALGRLDDGSPYLVMKLIRGRTLADLLKARSTPAEDLSKFIAIFEQIAQAVGFAHEQGIIHRDLKPLNVMVGAFGEVQVMDWGLAKDLSVSCEAQPSASSDTEDANLTTAGAIMGTPGYMAPEQARGEPADARADVFALGAILAAILTGKPAFVGTTARETIEKAARGDLSETLERLAASGADSELTALAKECLAADRSERPVDAKQVTTRVADYRLGVEQRLRQAETAKAEALVREAEGKKRRRAMQWAAGIITALLLAGVVGTGLAWMRSESNLAQAKTNLAFAKKGNEILGSVFVGLDPEEIAESGRPLQDVLREHLGRAVKEVEGTALGDVLEVAELQDSLGASLVSLGDFPSGTTVLEKALATRTAKLGPNHSHTLTSMGNLATANLVAGKLDRALPLLEETFKLRKAQLGLHHSDTVMSMNYLGEGYLASGRYHAALELLEQARDLLIAMARSDDPSMLTNMNSLARACRLAGKLDRALPLLEESLKLTTAQRGPDHPNTFTAMNNLAMGYRDAGKLDSAIPLFQKILDAERIQLGPDHPKTLTAIGNLASAYSAAKKHAIALPLYEEVLKLTKVKLGPDHQLTLSRMNNLADGYHDDGKLDLALPLYKETLKLQTAKLGPDHPDTLTTMNNLANGYRDLGKFDQALSLNLQTFELRKAKVGPDHPDTLASMHNLAGDYALLGNLVKALSLCEETVKRRKTILGSDHPDTHKSMSNLAGFYREAGRLDLALPLFEETVKLQKAGLGLEHPDTITTMSKLASAYRVAGRLDQALPLLEESLKLTKAQWGSDHSNTLTAMNNLATAYWSAKRLDQSIPLFEETLRLRQAKFGRDNPETLWAVANLGVNYKDAGRLNEALPLLEEVHSAAEKHPRLRGFDSQWADAYSRAGDHSKIAALLQQQLVQARQALPNDSAELAGALAQVGDALVKAKKHIDAEPLLRECLSIRQKLQADAWTTFNTQSLLGAALLGQKKYAEAEPLLLKGYECLKAREKTIPPQGATRIPEAIDRLVELYTATNKPQEVAKWKSERAKYASAQKAPASKQVPNKN
jgi:eukaryotic-like serine/threonine-protein kinase